MFLGRGVELPLIPNFAIAQNFVPAASTFCPQIFMPELHPYNKLSVHSSAPSVLSLEAQLLLSEGS